MHESYVLDGTLGTLTEPIAQVPFRDLAQIVHKMQRYSTLGVERLAQRDTVPSMASALAHGVGAFCRHYLVRLGFLDGWAGFVIALSNFEGTFYRYAKYAERRQALTREPTLPTSLRQVERRCSISVIVTTYNRPDALRAVLDGLRAQTDRDFEVLVADDGSRDDTGTLVHATARGAPIDDPSRLAGRPRIPCRRGPQSRDSAGGRRLCRVPRRRLRAAAALRRPASFARGIRMDGRRQPRAAVGGIHARRRWVPARRCTTWSDAQWQSAHRRGDINRTLPLRHLPLGPLRKLAGGRWQRVRTCNLGVWRTDLQRVNGFDEVFEGWGYEDSDLAVRLINSGVRRKEGAYATGVLHLWHREYDRRAEGDNWTRLQQRIHDRATRAERGLDQYTISS